MTRTPPRRGFALLEMTVVMGAMALCLTLGTVLLIGTTRTARVASATHTRTMNRAALTRVFRADVGGADATAARHAEHDAGPRCLILKYPAGRVVVYRFANEALTRIEYDGGKTFPAALALDPLTEAEFVVAGGLVTVKLTERLRMGAPNVWELSAAIGGDVR